MSFTTLAVALLPGMLLTNGGLVLALRRLARPLGEDTGATARRATALGIDVTRTGRVLIGVGLAGVVVAVDVFVVVTLWFAYQLEYTNWW